MTKPRQRAPHLPCARCGEGERRSGQSYCLVCNREANRASRMKNPAYAFLMEWKTGPCIDCGVEFPPEVMECDHVRGTKSFQCAGWSVLKRTVEQVAAELAKCERRCPNCHRMRHYRTFN